MALTAAQLAKQKKAAEELLFSAGNARLCQGPFLWAL
jgi:hypothetical protein